MRMEDKQIAVVKNWLELKSVWDIQVFIGFTNFSSQLIQCFSRIAALLTLMLKTTLATSLTFFTTSPKSGFLTSKAKLAFTKLR